MLRPPLALRVGLEFLRRVLEVANGIGDVPVAAYRFHDLDPNLLTARRRDERRCA